MNITICQVESEKVTYTTLLEVLKWRTWAMSLRVAWNILQDSFRAWFLEESEDTESHVPMRFECILHYFPQSHECHTVPWFRHLHSCFEISDCLPLPLTGRRMCVLPVCLLYSKGYYWLWPRFFSLVDIRFPPIYQCKNTDFSRSNRLLC